MKRKIFFCFCFLPLLLLGQVFDDFEGEALGDVVKWEGDVDAFVFDQGRLRLNGQQASSLYHLTTENQLAHSCEWEFSVETKFNPSSTNYVRIYLLSDQQSLKAALHGYYLQLGQSGGKNQLNFYRQDSLASTLLFSGSSVFSKTSGLNIRIKVARSEEGEWQLFSKNHDADAFQSEGIAFVDSSYLSANYFGFYCRYSTASRYNMYYFDDLRISEPIPDTVKPFLKSAAVVDQNTVLLEFSEEIEQTSGELLSNYLLNGELLPSRATADEDLLRYSLHFDSTFQNALPYSLLVENLQDLFGNRMEAEEVELLYYHIDQPQETELLINEVLFNPYGGGAAFVEIYNNTDKYFLLSDLYLATLNTTKDFGAIKQLCQLESDTNLLLVPGDYFVLSKDVDNVSFFYDCCNEENFVQMKTFPRYATLSGTVILCLKDSTILDRFDYDESMHHPLLAVNKGVSLERVSADLPTMQAGNWQSASETVGFATPGCANSQGLSVNTTSIKEPDHLYIPSPVVSPDNDGIQDVMEIYYQFEEAGYMASLYVFNVQGQVVRRILNHELLGTSGLILWDGCLDSKMPAPIGIYVLFMEAVHPSGKVKQVKKTVVVALR